MIEKNLGSGIMHLKVPSVKSVMKTMRRRIAASVIAALPESELLLLDMQTAGTEPDSAASGSDETIPKLTIPPAAEVGTETVPASPFVAKVCRHLIERLGSEKAVEALVRYTYGKLLDPERYGPVTEFSEEDFKDTGKTGGRGFQDRGRRGRPISDGRPRTSGSAFSDTRRTSGSRGTGTGFGATGKKGHPGREPYFEANRGEGFTRVYVGLGRSHGAGAREVASLLMRAGGVSNRQVDEIEMKDYCSYATLPTDAARKAFADSKNRPQDPVIRPAHSKRGDLGPLG